MNNPASQSNKTPWIAALTIAIIFFTINGLLTYRYAHLMAINTTKISHNMYLLSLIEAIKAQLFRAESAQRGYVITAEELYLAPYNESVPKLRSLVKSLEETISANPKQSERFNQIHRLVSEKLAEMDRTIELISQNKERSAHKLIGLDQGFQLSLKLIMLVEELQSDEYTLLNKNQQTTYDNHEFMMWALLITNAAGLCLAIAALYGTFRYSNRISNLYGELAQANFELEEKVHLRTSALKRYSEELERSNRELEDFAFVASHDLQEPLRKIRAFSDRLVKKYSGELGDQGRDYISRMYAASERMSRLIEDLLNFSRVSTKKREFESVDLNVIIQDAIDNLDFVISDRSAVITAGPFPVIEGDASQLRQVFSNLLSNSLKFTDPNTTPTISITSRNIGEENAQEPNSVCITVSDNGIGFDERYKDRIFNLFQRLHGKDEYSGTGIGLAICRKIVGRHGGSIDVRSEIGKGTEFSIQLPIRHQSIHHLISEAAA
jgi:signal transduction histidine kinase